MEDDLTVSLSTNPCQYSLNGTEWNDLQADEQTPAINTGEKIYFKIENLTLGSNGRVGTFTVSKRFNLSGNVMSMIYGDEAEGKISFPQYRPYFTKLFYGCTGLEKVSKNFLPATTLMFACYRSMFEGCTSLVQAPELPATVFNDEYHYEAMFKGCTSLVQAPELPATWLGNYCYYEMFRGCTSLVKAPELPATDLFENCYAYMFADCTSLVTAPELPATDLYSGCYMYMFAGCTSLNYIKCLSLDELNPVVGTSYNPTKRWVANVSPTGTFVMSKDATWDPEKERGMNGIPEGWTVETA